MRIIGFTLALCLTSLTYGQTPILPDLNSPQTRAIVGAQLATGKLISELRVLAFSAGNLPPNLQQDLRQGCEAATFQVNTLYRMIRVGSTWLAFQNQGAIVNQSLSNVSVFVRRVAPNDVQLMQALNRVEVQWQLVQVQFAQSFGGFNPINPGGPLPGPQQPLLINLVRSLESQAEALYVVGKQTLPHDQWGVAIEQAIQGFARSCAALRIQFEQNVAFAAALGDVRIRWEGLTQALSAVPLNQLPAIRQQASRVDQLYRTLFQALGQPQIPQPNFPINNLKQHGVIAVGAGEGGSPVVRTYQDRIGVAQTDFMAYDPEFRGGVRVAVGDVNGDGVVDIITAPGPGMQPLVRIFDGRDQSLLNQFLAYDQRFQSGVFVAAADVTGNGRAEIVCGAGDPGGPHVRAFDGMTGQVKTQFFAYDERLQCGVRVALGDVDGDGVPDIITGPGPGIEPIVKVINGRSVQTMTSFLAYERAFGGGVFVAAADVNRNGRAEIITGAGATGGPDIRVFDPMTGQIRFQTLAYDAQFRGGVRVAVCDALGDRRPDLITAPGQGVPPLIRIFRNRDGQLVREFAAFDPSFTGGVWIAGN